VKAAASVTHLHILAVVETELEAMRRDGTARVLDAGCGDGTLMAYLQANLEELSTADEVVRNLRGLVPDTPWDGRVQVVSVDEPWPYPDAHFDGSSRTRCSSTSPISAPSSRSCRAR
jgi:hypothetical protein